MKVICAILIRDTVLRKIYEFKDKVEVQAWWTSISKQLLEETNEFIVTCPNLGHIIRKSEIVCISYEMNYEMD